MADLLKRLKISEQQYGVGMEDNPFQDVSNDEAMKVCFGGGGGGRPPPPPPQTIQQQTSNIPEYFQPYLERLFERAEGVTTEPFQRYEGQRLALPTEQQQQAYRGVEEMVGGYKPYIATADLLTAQAAQQSTDPAAVTARMSPYQQAVVDIQKREALRDANKLQQQIGASAVGAGAFGGSRQALAETELARQTGQRLADIQAVGSQQAFQQAMNQLSADRAASLAAGQQFAGLGAQQQQLGLAGLGALETVGGTQQAQQQKALDIAYEDFARETTRPSQQVQEMSSVLRGFNLPVSTYTTSQAQQAPPTFGQQAAGLGLGALGIYGAGKGVGLFAEGGDVPDNPGIKKLAAKAPQVVEKMGFDPQEVMNAYIGGRMNYEEGGDTGSSISDFLQRYGTPANIATGVAAASPFLYGLARKAVTPFRLAKDQLELQKRMQGMTKAEKKLYLEKVIKGRKEKLAEDPPFLFGRSAKEIGQSISSKAKDIAGSFKNRLGRREVDEVVEGMKQRGESVKGKYDINLPAIAGRPTTGTGRSTAESNLPAVVTGRPMGTGTTQAILRTDPTRDLFNLTEKETQDQVPPAEDQVDDGDDDKNKVVEKDTSTLDRLKELLSQKPEDMTGISQAVAGLQALTVGENIRTGRTPLSQMGAQIGEVGQSFAAVDKAKRNLIKDEIASLATLAGLEQNEAKIKAAALEAQLDRTFKYHKLNIDQQIGIFKALAGEVGLMQQPPEEIIKLVDKISAGISGKETLQTEGEEIGQSRTGQKIIKVKDGQLKQIGG
tara:strand:+ start:378 stop:2711 length:2334 start_codon:yes stop_codon:yes gene_type:complete